MKTGAAAAKSRVIPSPFSRKRYDAVLFDLDGVVTTTARVHSACWKKTFDEFLLERSRSGGAEFVPFDETGDYLEYVDGKPRLEGVRGFLLSRGIELPEGGEDSPPGEPSVFGLGNRKNEMFRSALERESPGIYSTSVALARDLSRRGFRLAVVSSSRNCRAVMKAAGIDGLFEVTVDGVSAAEKGLRGKPEPDTFLAAAALLKSAPERSVVVEDASSGVAAGRRGGFGLVIGVARKDNEDELLASGAHMAVRDLGEFDSGGAEEGG